MIRKQEVIVIEDYEPNKYEYSYKRCSDRQMSWQKKVIDLLGAMSESIVKRTSAFNIANHDRSVDKDVSVVIMSDWLKFLDSVMLLISLGKFDTSLVLVRTMLELSIQLSYMLLEDNETRAAYYIISHVIKNHKTLQLLKEQKNKNNIIDAKLELLNDIKTAHNDFIVDVAKRILEHIGEISEAKSSWFTLYSKVETIDKTQKAISISSMIGIVAEARNPEKGFLNTNIVYDYFSRFAHGYFALNNSYIKNNQQYFKAYECLDNADMVIIMIVKLAELNFISLYSAYEDEYGDKYELGKEINILEIRLGSLLNDLKELKQLEGNNDKNKMICDE